jgi:hypothetical protein
MAEISGQPTHPLHRLEAEDLEFILRFVLASGSLKDVAVQYGVSYPTIRGRLDRLIERLRQLAEGRTPDPMAELLSEFIEKGQLSARSARKILDVHRSRLDGRQRESDGEINR